MPDLWFVLLSVFVGLLPESIFFTLFFSFAIGIKERRLTLFCLIFLSNLILSAFFAFNIWYHVLFIFSMWAIMRLLYRWFQIAHIFLILIAAASLSLVSAVGYFLIPSYIAFVVINRMFILVAVFVFKPYYKRLYHAYMSVWNRSPDNKIKSLTMRNICVVTMNVLIFLINLAMIYISLNY